jgi:hypothetical protein
VNTPACSKYTICTENKHTVIGKTTKCKGTLGTVSRGGSAATTRDMSLNVYVFVSTYNDVNASMNKNVLDRNLLLVP